MPTPPEVRKAREFLLWRLADFAMLERGRPCWWSFEETHTITDSGECSFASDNCESMVVVAVVVGSQQRTIPTCCWLWTYSIPLSTMHQAPTPTPMWSTVVLVLGVVVVVTLSLIGGTFMYRRSKTAAASKAQVAPT